MTVLPTGTRSLPGPCRAATTTKAWRCYSALALSEDKSRWSNAAPHPNAYCSGPGRRLAELSRLPPCIESSQPTGGDPRASKTDDDTPCPSQRLLYNGICLPAKWPPHRPHYTGKVVEPPYLASPPPVINVSVGRQLFVDRFLVQGSAGLRLVYHSAKPHPANPVLPSQGRCCHLDVPRYISLVIVQISIQNTMRGV